MKMKGSRKVLFGAIALAVLGGAFALTAFKPDAAVSFSAFATAVVTITGIVIAGNFGEHVASRGQETSRGQEKAP